MPGVQRNQGNVGLAVEKDGVYILLLFTLIALPMLVVVSFALPEVYKRVKWYNVIGQLYTAEYGGYS